MTRPGILVRVVSILFLILERFWFWKALPLAACYLQRRGKCFLIQLVQMKARE